MTSSFRAVTGIVFACSVLRTSLTAIACVDNDSEIARLAQERDLDNISGCVDILSECSRADQVGETLRSLCCETCSGLNLGEGTIEDDLPDDSETVHLFLFGGQSECKGQGRPDDLQADDSYAELQGQQEGIWFAGYQLPASKESYFIAPLQVGNDNPTGFGPEASFGQRIHAVTGKRVMMVKYCVGGTSVSQNWNPEGAENLWDKAADDGTAQFLEGGINFESRNALFKNMIYTIRRTEEALTEASIPFAWSGIVWVQGQADTKTDPNPSTLWKSFGEDTARVWNGFRDEIQKENPGTIVPIIDTGSSAKNSLKSGKEYATQIVEGCHALNVEAAFYASQDMGSCTITPSNPCQGEEGVYVNPAIFEFYGLDPNTPDDMFPMVSRDQNTFHWYTKYPSNLHSAYEGMILKGRMLANAFLANFMKKDHPIPETFTSVDVAMKFPWEKCPDNGFTTGPDLICWHDYREADALALDDCAVSIEDGSTSSSQRKELAILSTFSALLAVVLQCA